MILLLTKRPFWKNEYHHEKVQKKLCKECNFHGNQLTQAIAYKSIYTLDKSKCGRRYGRFYNNRVFIWKFLSTPPLKVIMTQLPDETTIFGAQNHFKINMLGVNKKNEKNEKTVSSMFRRVFGQLTPLDRNFRNLEKREK